MNYPNWQKTIREAQAAVQAKKAKDEADAAEKKMQERREVGAHLKEVLALFDLHVEPLIDTVYWDAFKFTLLPFKNGGPGDTWVAKQSADRINFRLFITRIHPSDTDFEWEGLSGEITPGWSCQLENLPIWQARMADILDEIEATYQQQLPQFLNHAKNLSDKPAPEPAPRQPTAAEQLVEFLREIAREEATNVVEGWNA